MLPQEIIRKKRDGLILSKADIDIFVNGLLDKSFSDSQIASMTMAILLNDMNSHEIVNLTRAMTNSGDVLNWKGIINSDFICDKHSTGGVGDKVSLLLAPIIAACGGYVPMISGRGLGHTGGTLDKFDSIPGYNTQPDIVKFQKTVKEVGCAIIGQTPRLAPADKKLYSIRDVVATVESIPLIISSILSKKIASGLNNLVIDVKVGNGSFNPTTKIAVKLAKSLVNVAKDSGLKCRAILTNMNQVLGESAGNSLEVIECIEYFLSKKRNFRLQEITNELSVELLCMHNKNLSRDDAFKKIEEVINNGSAAEKFEKMVHSLGGPKKILSSYMKDLPHSKYCEDILSDKDGIIQSINTRNLGNILIELGGGRKKSSDKINHSVGFNNIIEIGKKITKKSILLTIHSDNKEHIDYYKKQISNCFNVSKDKIKKQDSIYEKIF